MSTKYVICIKTSNELQKLWMPIIAKKDPDDAGLDIPAPKDIIFNRRFNNVLDYELSVQIENQEGELISWNLVSRSSITRNFAPNTNSNILKYIHDAFDFLCFLVGIDSSQFHTCTLRHSNPVGVIDKGYRGNIIAKVDNYSFYDVELICMYAIALVLSAFFADLGILLFLTCGFFTVLAILIPRPYHVKKGQRLFQICLPGLNGFDVKFRNNLSPSKRGTGGFGSTGL